MDNKILKLHSKSEIVSERSEHNNISEDKIIDYEIEGLGRKHQINSIVHKLPLYVVIAINLSFALSVIVSALLVGKFTDPVINKIFAVLTVFLLILYAVSAIFWYFERKSQFMANYVKKYRGHVE